MKTKSCNWKVFSFAIESKKKLLLKTNKRKRNYNEQLKRTVQKMQSDGFSPFLIKLSMHGPSLIVGLKLCNLSHCILCETNFIVQDTFV